MRRGAAALLLAATLAACGGGSSSSGGPTSRHRGPALTTQQLTTRVNTECAQLSQAAADLTNAQDPTAHGARVERYLSAAASRLRSRVDAIARLNPPPSLASQLTRFVTLLGRYADQLGALARRTRASETYSQLLTRSSTQVNALNSLSDQTNRIAVTLGFTACVT